MAAAAVCVLCSHANPTDSSYCNSCGASLQLTLCANCDAVNHCDASSCHKCGTVTARLSTLAATANDPPNDDSVRRPASITPGPVDSSATDDMTTAPKAEGARRLLRPGTALLALSLIAVAAAAYYASHRGESVSPSSSSPQDAAAVSEVTSVVAAPAAAAQNENQAVPEMKPGSTTETPTASPSVEGPIDGSSQPAPEIAGTGLGTNPDEKPQERKQDATQAAGAQARIAPVAPHPQVENANVGRADAGTPPYAGSGERYALPAPPATSRDSNARGLGLAACTDAIAALGLCDRNKLEEGK